MTQFSYYKRLLGTYESVALFKRQNVKYPDAHKTLKSLYFRNDINRVLVTIFKL